MYTLASNANIISKHTGETIKQVIERMKKNEKGYNETVATVLRNDKIIPAIVNEVVLHKFTILPKQHKAWTVPEIKGILDQLVKANDIQKYSDEKLYSRVVKLDDGKVVENETVIMRNDLKYLIIPPDKEMLGFINARKILRESKFMFDTMPFVNNLVTTSGTLEGQMTRLKDGMIHNNNIIWKTRPKDMVQLLIKYFPRADTGHRLTDESVFTSSEYIPTWTSDAGCPYVDCKKGDVKIDLLVRAMELLKVIGELDSNTKILDYDLKHMRDTCVMIKNKLEMIEVAAIHNKIRSYFVLPGALALVFSMFQELYSAGWKNKPVNYTSLLIGHSSTHGGTTKLMEYFLSVKKGILFKVYSDDNTIAFVDQRGDVRIIAADVRHHDLSAKAKQIPIIQKYYDMVMVDEKQKPILTKLMRNVKNYNVVKAFVGPVMMKDKTIAYFMNGLKSGAPGTSIFGSLISGQPLAILAEKYKNDLFIDPFEFERELCAVFLQYGMTIKPGTEKSYIVRADHGWTSEFTILGMKMRCVKKEGKTNWLPVPDYQRLLASLLRPTKRETDKFESIRYRMLRCFGIALSGGYQHETLYNICQQYWDENIVNNELVLEEFDVSVPVALTKGVEEMRTRYNTGKRTFPPQKWFEDLYLNELLDESEEEEFEIKFHEAPDEKPMKPGELWADAMEEEDEEQEKAIRRVAEKLGMIIPASELAPKVSVELPDIATLYSSLVSKTLLTREDKKLFRKLRRRPKTDAYKLKIQQIKTQNQQIREEAKATKTIQSARTATKKKKNKNFNRDKRTSVLHSDTGYMSE